MIVYKFDGSKSHVLSTNLKTDTSGWAYYIGENEDGDWTGRAKYFNEDGRVFTGDWETDKMKNGEMSYLQADGTRIIKQVAYNVGNDLTNNIIHWDQESGLPVNDGTCVANEEYDTTLLAHRHLK